MDIIPGAAWKRRFNWVLKQANRVVTASDHRFSGNDVAYKYANFLQHGMAILRAQSLDTEVVPLALWDGKPGDGLWGTASFVAYWRSRGLEPKIIDASTLIGRKAGTRQERSQNRSTIKKGGLTLKEAKPKQNIRAMLFADVVAYSQIKDEEIPRFVDHFMGMVAEMVKASRHKPLTWNTWGDALYFVFKSPQDAGRYALQLRDRVRKTNWKRKGLPEGLGLRISLHTGPLYRCRDPVIKKYKYTGSHVSRAARIEPITPPGEVYASEAFAALAAAQKTEGFALDYVGRMPLPKKSGIVPLYLIRRTAV